MPNITIFKRRFYVDRFYQAGFRRKCQLAEMKAKKEETQRRQAEREKENFGTWRRTGFFWRALFPGKSFVANALLIAPSAPPSVNTTSPFLRSAAEEFTRMRQKLQKLAYGLQMEELRERKSTSPYRFVFSEDFAPWLIEILTKLQDVRYDPKEDFHLRHRFHPERMTVSEMRSQGTQILQGLLNATLTDEYKSFSREVSLRSDSPCERKVSLYELIFGGPFWFMPDPIRPIVDRFEKLCPRYDRLERFLFRRQFQGVVNKSEESPIDLFAGAQDSRELLRNHVVNSQKLVESAFLQTVKDQNPCDALQKQFVAERNVNEEPYRYAQPKELPEELEFPMPRFDPWYRYSMGYDKEITRESRRIFVWALNESKLRQKELETPWYAKENYRKFGGAFGKETRSSRRRRDLKTRRVERKRRILNGANRVEQTTTRREQARVARINAISNSASFRRSGNRNRRSGKARLGA